MDYYREGDDRQPSQEQPVAQDNREHEFYDPLKKEWVLGSAIESDNIILMNRESSDPQEGTHAPRIDCLKTTTAGLGKRVVERTFTGTGRIGSLLDFIDSAGSVTGYEATWFGFLQKMIEAELEHRFITQKVVIVLTTVDRLLRQPDYHPQRHSTHTLRDSDFAAFEKWLSLVLGEKRKHIQFLVCYFGGARADHGFNIKQSIRFFGSKRGRGKGTRNKKRNNKRQKTPKEAALLEAIRVEIPFLVRAAGFSNGTECYRDLVKRYGKEIPCSLRWVQKEVQRARGCPGKPGRTRKAESQAQPNADAVPTPILQKGSKIKYEQPYFCCKNSNVFHPDFFSLKRTWEVHKHTDKKALNIIRVFSPSFLNNARNVSRDFTLFEKCETTLSKSQRSILALKVYQIRKLNDAKTTEAEIAEEFFIGVRTLKRAIFIAKALSRAMLRKIWKDEISLRCAESTVKLAASRLGIEIKHATESQKERIQEVFDEILNEKTSVSKKSP